MTSQPVINAFSFLAGHSKLDCNRRRMIIEIKHRICCRHYLLRRPLSEYEWGILRFDELNEFI